MRERRYEYKGNVKWFPFFIRDRPYSANQIIMQVGFLAILTKILVLPKLFQRGYLLTVPFHYSRKVPDFYLPYLLKKIEKIENGVNQIIMQVENLIIFL